jgi:hypothetical protein
VFRRGWADGSRTRRPFKERQQRQLLPQLVPGAPEHLAARRRRLGHRRPHQGGLPDPGLALDQHHAAAALRHLFHQAGQQRQFVFAADQRHGRGHRHHEGLLREDGLSLVTSVRFPLAMAVAGECRDPIYLVANPA